MEEIVEEFISGFCRTFNSMSTVTSEYTIKDGKRVLTFMDCAHASCLHHAACQIYKEAHQYEKQGE